MTKELTSLHSRHLRRAWSLAESAIAGMSDEQMTWAPEGKWSSANLLEHLSLGCMITAKGCRMALRQSSPDVPKPTWAQRRLAFQVIDLGHFPKRVNAPKNVCPRGQSPEGAKCGLLANLVELDGLLWQCAEKFGSGVAVISHPYLGPLTIRQWRKFQLFHVRRHVRQIHRLRQQMAQASRENSVAPVRPSPA